MAEFTVNNRFDPYKNMKFLVRWDGKIIPGVSKMSPLSRNTEVVKHREGGDPSSSRKSPGRTEFDPIIWNAASLMIQRLRNGSTRSGILEVV